MSSAGKGILVDVGWRTTLAARMAVIVGLAVLGLAGPAAASPTPNANPWLNQLGVLNMAHQGGELEAPSSTLYAFKTAISDRGADTLEMDAHVTKDGRVVILHDDTVTRATPVTGAIEDMTLAEVQALDAAYWFSPGRAHYDHSLDPSEYPLRGVRTGDRPPPPGYAPEDFRIPTLEEVLAAFPDTPINIEIKTTDGFANEGYARRTADHLGPLLSRPEYRGRRIIIASTAQSALERLRQSAPSLDVSASITSMLSFISDGTPIEPRPVALQVPIRIGNLDLPTMLRERDANGLGYAVHAWTDSSADENDETYGFLVGSGVQGIMTMAPSVLHDYLCRAGQRRPDGAPRCPEQKMSHKVAFPSKSIRKLTRGGLPVKVRCSTSCRARVEIRVAAKLNRRLKLGGRSVKPGQARIGDRSQRLKANGATVRVKLTARAAKRLRKVRKARVQVVVTLTDGFGWSAGTVRRSLVLRARAK